MIRRARAGTSTRYGADVRRRAKAKQDRAEGAVEKKVRETCVARDGYCRLFSRCLGISAISVRQAAFGTCGGASEWSHLGAFKRFKTRGQAPEHRHCTQGSLILCTKHHHDYDAGRLAIDGTTAGADGPLRFMRGGVTYAEAK